MGARVLVVALVTWTAVFLDSKDLENIPNVLSNGLIMIITCRRRNSRVCRLMIGNLAPERLELSDGGVDFL